jgi:ureidoacrylate peracid hydrolase
MGSVLPFATASWSLVPRQTALVVIDMQNDFLHPDGWYSKSGVDISEPTKTLVAEARVRGVPIVWTRHGFKDERDAGVFMRLRPFLAEGGLRQGSWGYELLDDMGAAPEDWYVEKNRLSAFYNTNFELILRAMKAETLLVAGVLTNQCVAATSKDANFRDFKPIVVAECTGTTLPHLHEPALEMMSVGWCEVRSLEDTLRQIRGLPLSN